MSAKKPLRFSIISINDNRPLVPEKYIVPILDGAGNLTELYWDGEGMAGLNVFAAVNMPGNGTNVTFGSIAVVDVGSMFAISDGKIFQFERQTHWWEEQAAGSPSIVSWRFVDAVNLTIAKGK